MPQSSPHGGVRSVQARDALVLAAAGLLFGLLCLLFRHFTVDDAFIAYRHARNLAQGLGPVMNAGERVEGVSNLPWTALLGLLAAAGLEPHRLGPLLSALCGWVCVILSARVVARTTPSHHRASWAAMLAAATPPLAAWSMSGMETCAYALLVLALVLHSAGDAASPRRAWGAGLWLGALGAMRPEGVIFAAPLVVSAVQQRAAAVRVLRIALGAAFVLVPMALFRRWYYGDWLPNPVYAKASFAPAAGVLYVAKLVLTYPLLFAAWWSVARRERGVPATTLVAGCILVQLMFTIAVGGDRFPGYRFAVPIVPLLAVSAVLAQRPRSRVETRSPRWHGLAAALLFAAGLACLARPDALVPAGGALLRAARAQRGIETHADRLRQEARHAGVVLLGLGLWSAARATTTRSLLERHEDVSRTLLILTTLVPSFFDPQVRACLRPDPAAAYGRPVGEWLRATQPPGTLVATNAAGSLPYHARLPVIDMLGLTDRHIAHQLADPRRWIGHEKGDGAYVLGRRPDIVILGGPEGSAEPWPFAGDQQLAAAPEFHRDYVLRRVALPGFELVYYQRRDARERGAAPLDARDPDPIRKAPTP